MNRKNLNLYTRKGSSEGYKPNYVIKERSLIGGAFLFDEGLIIKKRLIRIYHWLISKGKAKIYYVVLDNKIVHTECVTGKCKKFFMLKDNDLYIGPSFTLKEYRRKGIHNDVLKYIINNSNENINYYCEIDKNNIASIESFKKVGFKQVNYD